VAADGPPGPDGWPSGGALPDESGLFRERTELARSRSGLAVVLVVAVLLRRLWPLGGTETFAVLVTAGAGSLAWSAGMVLARRGQSTRTAFRPSDARAAGLLTAGTVLLAVAGLVLALASPG
jgi:hypothetical protein